MEDHLPRSQLRGCFFISSNIRLKWGKIMEAFDCTLVAGVVEWSRHVADLVPVITHCHVEKERSKVIQVMWRRKGQRSFQVCATDRLTWHAPSSMVNGFFNIVPSLFCKRTIKQWRNVTTHHNDKYLGQRDSNCKIFTVPFPAHPPALCSDTQLSKSWNSLVRYRCVFIVYLNDASILMATLMTEVGNNWSKVFCL